jgi:hypothetical protein
MKGGAGYEKQIMTSELIIDQNTSWIIPLIKNNPKNKKTPTFLGGRMYINFEETHLAASLILISFLIQVQSACEDVDREVHLYITCRPEFSLFKSAY